MNLLLRKFKQLGERESESWTYFRGEKLNFIELVRRFVKLVTAAALLVFIFSPVRAPDYTTCSRYRIPDSDRKSCSPSCERFQLTAKFRVTRVSGTMCSPCVRPPSLQLQTRPCSGDCFAFGGTPGNPRYVAALSKQILLIRVPIIFSSLGSWPLSISAPIKLHRIRLKYS